MMPTDTELVMTEEQFAHLKDNESLVVEHQHDPNWPDYNVTVEEWVSNAEEDAPYEGYYYMCLDIGLDPLEPHPS